MNEAEKQLLLELREQRQTKKTKISQLEEEIEDINKKILEIFKRNNETEFIDGGLNTQVIQNTTTKYNWDGIRSDIGLANWKQIVREVPDVKLLQKLLADGKIKPSAISKHQTVEDKGEPFVKVSRARSEDDV